MKYKLKFVSILTVIFFMLSCSSKKSETYATSLRLENTQLLNGDWNLRSISFKRIGNKEGINYSLSDKFNVDNQSKEGNNDLYSFSANGELMVNHRLVSKWKSISPNQISFSKQIENVRSTPLIFQGVYLFTSVNKSSFYFRKPFYNSNGEIQLDMRYYFERAKDSLVGLTEEEKYL